MKAYQIRNALRITVFILVVAIFTTGLVFGMTHDPGDNAKEDEASERAIVHDFHKPQIEAESIEEDEVEEVVDEVILEAETETLKPDGVYTLTAYCGCSQCCGAWATDPDHIIGSGGVELIEGVHCASPLPNGTVVEIEGLGRYEVQDSTAQWIVEKYNGKIIDIYFESHQRALEFGKRQAEVSIVYQMK